MWSSPLSLPLWIPGQSLPGDGAGRLPEGVSLLHVFLGLPLWIPGQSLPGDVAGRFPEGVSAPCVPGSSPVDSRSESSWRCCWQVS